MSGLIWCFLALVFVSGRSVNAGDVDVDYVAAIRSDDLRRVAALFESVADVDLATEKGKTALMLAAKYARLDLLSALIAKGADVNATNQNGGTPLMYSAIPGSVAGIDLLLANGSAVDAMGRNGWTATMIAAAKGHADGVAALLSHGASPNTRDIYGWTPLMRATWENRPAVVRILLDTPGIRVNDHDNQGATALHHAAAKGLLEVARMLVEQGADSDLHDDAGRTAADRAAVMGHSAIVAYLRSAGRR